jgi:hypothetical protein
MTLRRANAYALERLGPGASCETVRDGRFYHREIRWVRDGATHTAKWPTSVGWDWIIVDVAKSLTRNKP